MYDTAISPYTYTRSENIDIAVNQISLKHPFKINDEIVLNPRLNVYLNYMLEHQVLPFYKTP